ncbi:MAG: arabinose ABC transporter permease [Alphaproteobacteria bacterium]|nr:arabinose ABC transporter permease [Alphaproteobacteria bacterium]HCP01171.1 arabinose ABC transporter permease [Rhodospirillaceae bacterium]
MANTPERPASVLAPFAVRSFRFQWPADLATSWSFEMETLILGWYILVTTDSVLLLTLFAALQYGGTLVAPMFGVAGDRKGARAVLSTMRTFYMLQAAALTGFIYFDALGPLPVFVIGAMMGIVRPSDIAIRYSLVGETIPPKQLVGAMGVSRTTTDSARVAGALAGASLVATLGMAPAYIAVTLLYATSALLTLLTARRLQTDAVLSPDLSPRRSSPFRDMTDSFAYVWRTPHLLAAMTLALLVNLCAFPLMGGVLPYVAREVYGTGQAGLGYLAASFAFGALLGSLGLSAYRRSIRPGRMMIIYTFSWYALLLVFAWVDVMAVGIVVLILAGLCQTLALVPLSVMLLRSSDPQMRSRILGLRMLAIYGLPMGLLASGPLIEAFGYTATATAYGVLGVIATAFIAWHWRADVWRADAIANRG